MDRFRVRYIILPVIKAFVSMTVVAMLLYPTKIYRHDLSSISSNFSQSMTNVSVNGKHFFCRIPEARAMKVDQTKVVEALDLPNGTKIDDALQKFGECRAKVLRLNENDDVCSCNPRIFFIIAIVMGVIATFVNFGHACFGPWEPDSSCAFYKFLDSFSWILISVTTVVNEYTNAETITLPNSSESEPYFEPVFLWYVACSCGFVYAILAAINGVVFLKFSDDKKDTSKKKYGKDRAVTKKNVEPKRTFVVQDIEPICRPSGRMEKGIDRLMMVRESVQPHWQVVTITCRTWP